MLVAQGHVRPVPDHALEAGSLVRPDEALGGDDAPACAANSSEQDDFAEKVLIPPGGRGTQRSREHLT